MHYNSDRHESTGKTPYEMNGVDWSALARDRRDQILASADPEVFEKEVHKLVAELKTSHTGFRHAGMRNIPARGLHFDRHRDRVTIVFNQEKNRQSA